MILINAKLGNIYTITNITFDKNVKVRWGLIEDKRKFNKRISGQSS